MVESVWLLSGGAFHGAHQVPVIRRLLATEGLPDLILGVSVGSINGVMAAQESIDDLEAIWNSLDQKSWWFGVNGFLSLSLSLRFWKRKGVYSLKPLRKKLRRLVSLGKLRTQYGAGVVLRQTKKYVTLRSSLMQTDEQLHTAILGSSAIAGIMNPWHATIEGERYTLSDGGHRHVVPLPPDGVKNITAILTFPLNAAEPDCGEDESLIGSVSWAADIQMDATTIGDVQNLRRLALSGHSVRVFAPKRRVGGMLTADRATIQERLAIGQEAADDPITF